MSRESMRPYGAALLDYFNGDRGAALSYERDDGSVWEEPVSVFFRPPAEFFRLEHTALGLCRGDTLDIGAGAGVHSLVLQERGMDVTAIDISPEAVAVMSKSGVVNPRCADVFNFSGKRFDTLLMLGRGIGMVGDLKGLAYFLRDVRRLLKSGGQLILNSCSPAPPPVPEEVSRPGVNVAAGRYIGEIGLRLFYKGIEGAPFSWLHVDPETLSGYAFKAGWQTEIVEREEDGNYLARLTAPDG